MSISKTLQFSFCWSFLLPSSLEERGSHALDVRDMLMSEDSKYLQLCFGKIQNFDDERNKLVF